MTDNRNDLPLAGVRVLDLTRLLPGPLCTLWLADLGADVIKIEDPQGGDYVRWMPPHPADELSDLSAMFTALNRNKKSVTLDLKTDGDREKYFGLVKTADVVVEGFRPGVMDKLGVGYETLRGIKPDIVMCGISGYGQTGPLAKRAGHDVDYMARAGALGLFGPREGLTAPPGVQVGDIAGGSYNAAFAIVAALFRKLRTGRGAYVDVAMTEGVTAFLTMALAERAGRDQPLRRGDETLIGGLPCYNVYRCSDGKLIALGALEPKFWEKFCAASGHAELIGDGHSSGPAGHAAQARVAAVFATKTRDAWAALLDPADACVEAIYEGDEVFSDPQHAARKMFIDVPVGHGSRATVRTAGFPFVASWGTRDVSRLTPPPRLGEHNKELL